MDVKKSSRITKMVNRMEVKHASQEAITVIDLYSRSPVHTYLGVGIKIGRKAGSRTIYRVSLAKSGLLLFFLGTEREILKRLKKRA